MFFFLIFYHQSHQGAENIEMSLKAWTCGGRIEFIPCAVIGHVFPDKPFYNRESAVSNTVRLVETWIGKVKNMFFYLKSQNDFLFIKLK